MRETIGRIDLARCRAAGERPCDVVRREGPRDTWLVLAAPLSPGGMPRWHVVVSGDYVRVEAVPYLTLPAPADALAFAAQWGARVVKACEGRGALRMHLSFADAIEAVGPEGAPTAFRVHLGAAIQVEERSRP